MPIITHLLTAVALEGTPAALAAYLTTHPAPDVKPQGAQNDPLLVHMCRLVGPAHAHPAIEDVAACTGLALDLDGAAGAAISQVVQAIQATGVGGVLSESHSHSAHAPSYHFRAWYDTECPPNVHRQVWRAFSLAVAPMGPQICHNPNRGFNAPRRGACVGVIPGAALDWRVWAARAPVTATVAVSDECPPALVGARDAWAAEAATWLAAQPPAIEGQGGDPATWRVALGLVRGWVLSHACALRVLDTWNARCQPPWPREALERKLQMAATDGTIPWGCYFPNKPGSIDQALTPADLVAPASPPVAPVAALADAPPLRDPNAWLDMMNAKHAVLTQIGGKCKVLSWDASDLGAVPVLQSFDDLKNRYCHVRVPIEGGDSPSLGVWWLTHPARREALSLTFAPLEPAIVNGRINTWSGYGCAAVAGEWPRMQALIGDVIASGVPDHAEYIVKWMAWVLQHPGERAEVVLVLRGKKGTGKNTLLDTLCSLLGPHALTVSSPRHLTGNFNAHLHACALLFANEAIPPNDKPAEAVLKALVTDPTLAIERKGVDVEQRRNALSICMASNEEWCVPAGLDERRFAVFDVSDARIQDHDYFEAIRTELANGGREAMLYALLTLDLGAWHPRRAVPQTAALVEQQLDGLRGADRAVYQMLASGELSGAMRVPADEAPEGCTFVATRLMAAALKWDLTRETALGRALARCVRPVHAASSRQCGVGLDANARRRGYWVPPLAEARARWATAMRLNVTWPIADEWAGS